jgi:group I intron endonuclease
MHKRWAKHLSDSRNQSQSPLHRAIRRDGVDSFTICSIATGCLNILDYLEQLFIITLDTLTEDGRGYNLEAGGNEGKSVSDATKAKISASTKGKPGKRVSDETKAKLSAINTGKCNLLIRGIPLSTEHRAKLSASHKGQLCPMKGKRHSPEARAKMRDAALRRNAAKKGLQPCQ